MGRNWRRRNYFIKKDLQGQYIFTIFVAVLFACLLFTAIFSMLTADSMTITYKDNSLNLGKTPFVLVKELLRANWIFLLTGGFFIVVLALFVTHRLAGPLYRFEKTLEGMLIGDHSFVIRLRTNDEAKEVATLFNQYNAKISADTRQFIETTEAIRNNLARAEGSADPEEIRHALSEASELSEKQLLRLRNYKLTHDQ